MVFYYLRNLLQAVKEQLLVIRTWCQITEWLIRQSEKPNAKKPGWVLIFFIVPLNSFLPIFRLQNIIEILEF